MTVFDNLMGILRSGELARAITAPTWTDRILGVSKDAVLPVRTTWVGTGNNIILGGDLPRRSYQIRIDAEQAAPWLRREDEFRHADLRTWATDNRGHLLWALLVIARSWWSAGCPESNAPVLGGFESWNRVVGGVLANADVGHFLGNLQTMYDTMDIESEQWGPFLAAWYRAGGKSYTRAGAVAELLSSDERMGNALPDELADGRSKGNLTLSKQLGKALRYKVGRFFIYDGHEYAVLRSQKRGQHVYRVTRRQ